MLTRFQGARFVHYDIILEYNKKELLGHSGVSFKKLLKV
jgi:hypothetical protein